MLPLITEYTNALRNASDSLKELLPIELVLDEQGNPKFAAGNFAVVYKMRRPTDGKLFALKCFTRDVPDRDRRLGAISQWLAANKGPYWAEYQYHPTELWVDSATAGAAEYPVVLMEWIEGKTLGERVAELCDNKDKEALRHLADRFAQLVHYLLQQPIAHGDLKHDNILVRLDNTLALVDYDGMYVPALQGIQAAELGGSDYQSLKRNENDFDEHIDAFSMGIIATSLYCLAERPDLHRGYCHGNNLIFSRTDWQNPFGSKLLKELNGVSELTDTLLQGLQFGMIVVDNASICGYWKEKLPRPIFEFDKEAFNRLSETWLYILEGNIKGCENMNVRQFVKAVNALTKLNCGDISNFEGMPLLPNLTELSCDNNYVSSFKGMPVLPNLNILYCGYNYITTFEGMPELPNLTELHCYCNKITSFEGMPELPNLTELNCSDNQITTFEGMPELPNLTELNCSDNQITTFEGMPELPNLIKLDYSDNEITSFEGMPELQNLTELSCHGNKITSFEGMPGLPNLNILYYGKNNLKNFKGMPKLPKLTKLNCGNNNIKSFEGMPELPNLTNLDLFENKLTSFEGMPELPNLIKLDYSDNEITSFEGMPELQNLTELSCHGNKITSFKGMPELPNLTELYCEKNNIKSFKGMPELPNLTDLDLYENKLTSFEGLPELPKLTTLDCGRNQFTNFEGIRELPKLVDFNIYGNKLTSFKWQVRLSQSYVSIFSEI